MISKTVLVLAERFGDGLDGGHVASALARGLEAGGQLACDCCGLEASAKTRSRAVALLDECDFDRRMRAARAVVIAREHLDDRTLAGSVAFEAATRARQGGVPAYAVTAHDRLDPFEARIVDLQMVIEAGTTRALSTAGRKLASVI